MKIFIVLFVFLIAALSCAQDVGLNYATSQDLSHSFALMTLEDRGAGIYLGAGSDNSFELSKTPVEFLNVGLTIAQNKGMNIYKNPRAFIIHFYSAIGIQRYNRGFDQTKFNFAGGFLFSIRSVVLKFGLNSASTFEYGLGLRF